MDLPHPQYLNHAREIAEKLQIRLTDDNRSWITFDEVEIEDLPHESYDGFWCWINGGILLQASYIQSVSEDSTYHLTTGVTDCVTETVERAEKDFCSNNNIEDFNAWYSRERENHMANGTGLDEWYEYVDSYLSDMWQMLRFKIQFYEPDNHQGNRFRKERDLPETVSSHPDFIPSTGPGMVLVSLGAAYRDAPYMRETFDEEVFERVFTYDEFLEWEPDMNEILKETAL